MINRMAVALAAFMAYAATASAHTTQMPHPHPHAMELMYSSEMTALVLISALVAVLVASHLLPKRLKRDAVQRKTRSHRSGE